MNSTVQMDFFPMLLPTSMYVEDAAKANSQTEVFVMLFPGNMRSEYLLPSNSTGKNIHFNLDVVKTLKTDPKYKLKYPIILFDISNSQSLSNIVLQAFETKRQRNRRRYAYYFVNIRCCVFV